MKEELDRAVREGLGESLDKHDPVFPVIIGSNCVAHGGLKRRELFALVLAHGMLAADTRLNIESAVEIAIVGADKMLRSLGENGGSTSELKNGGR